MSNYYRETKNPKTGKWETAEWLDNYFGPNKYGVRFGKGAIYNPEVMELETKEFTAATIQDVVRGTPVGQKAVQRAMEKSAQAQEKLTNIKPETIQDIVKSMEGTSTMHGQPLDLIWRLARAANRELDELNQKIENLREDLVL